MNNSPIESRNAIDSSRILVEPQESSESLQAVLDRIANISFASIDTISVPVLPPAVNPVPTVTVPVIAFSVPTNLYVDTTSAIYRPGIDGTQRVSIKAFFDDVPGAVSYEVKVIPL